MVKTPLVLVPGLLCTGDLWAAQVAALSDIADCQIADHTRHNTISGIARSIIESMPRSFALAGLSMGGYIAFEIMRQTPERVERLALLDTSALGDNEEERRNRLALIEFATEDFERFLDEYWLLQMLPTGKLNDKKLRDQILAMARDTGVDAYVRQQQAIISRPDSRPVCEQISCPVTVIVGDLDQATPLARHEEIQRITPGSELIVIEACGHLSTLEAPNKVNSALRNWLVR